MNTETASMACAAWTCAAARQAAQEIIRKDVRRARCVDQAQAHPGRPADVEPRQLFVPDRLDRARLEANPAQRRRIRLRAVMASAALVFVRRRARRHGRLREGRRARGRARRPSRAAGTRGVPQVDRLGARHSRGRIKVYLAGFAAAAGIRQCIA